MDNSHYGSADRRVRAFCVCLDSPLADSAVRAPIVRIAENLIKKSGVNLIKKNGVNFRPRRLVPTDLNSRRFFTRRSKGKTRRDEAAGARRHVPCVCG